MNPDDRLIPLLSAEGEETPFELKILGNADGKLALTICSHKYSQGIGQAGPASSELLRHALRGEATTIKSPTGVYSLTRSGDRLAVTYQSSEGGWNKNMSCSLNEFKRVLDMIEGTPLEAAMGSPLRW